MQSLLGFGQSDVPGIGRYAQNVRFVFSRTKLEPERFFQEAAKTVAARGKPCDLLGDDDFHGAGFGIVRGGNPQ